ncbi:AAA family ATPase [Lacrimispora saccharolytica]|nr:AAA family ATPase [Lacrimispora saccharolytica]
MSQFYCREDELRKLNKRYAGGKFGCIVIYGRRRVGKTALINEFCKDKPTIFFSASIRMLQNSIFRITWV